MGNCMETWSSENQQYDTEKQQQQQQQQQQLEKKEEEEEEKASGFVKESGVIRVKVILTKEELEWLMFQLENRRDKRLEDILEEIKRGRSSVKPEQGWTPSLESIMEIPELPEMDR